MNTRLYSFAGGKIGPWRVTSMAAYIGEPLPLVERLAIYTEPDTSSLSADTPWILRGITSNERYVHRDEKQALVARQEDLGRAEAKYAALIPIQKSPAWWALTQDERRAIFEEQSNHIRIGMNFLPAIARRLHHCRDLGPDEPFDFLTWFEYAPSDTAAFNDLLAHLRASPEWRYVSRELDIRLSRE